MTDSHIPNSKAAPDWRELPYERTSFDNAIELTIVKGFIGRYSGFATQDWCTPRKIPKLWSIWNINSNSNKSDDAGPSLHGGYISSIFIAGSRKYFRSQRGNLNQPDPITMHVQFLQLVPQGSFHVVFEDLKLGHRQSTIQGKILSSDLNIHTIYALAIFTMGDLNSNVGISISLPPIPTPNRERDCTRWTSGFFYHINPPSSACRCYNPKDGPDIMWSPKLGRNKRDQWNKLDNEDNIRLEHLGLIADLVRLFLSGIRGWLKRSMLTRVL